MALKPGHIDNFNTLLRAARDGRLALMECTEKVTGEPRAVICAVNVLPNRETQFIPFCALSEGNPFDEFLPPE